MKAEWYFLEFADGNLTEVYPLGNAPPTLVPIVLQSENLDIYHKSYEVAPYTPCLNLINHQATILADNAQS